MYGIIITITILLFVAFYAWFKERHFTQYWLAKLTGREHKFIESQWSHKWTGEEDLSSAPFVGSAVIRLGDKELIFVGGGHGQDDVLLELVGDKFVNRGKDMNISQLSATYCAAQTPLGLAVGRADGIWLHKDGVAKLIWPMSDRMPLGIAVGSIDGKQINLYISCFTKTAELKSFQFNNPSHVKHNILLREQPGKRVRTGWQEENNINWIDITADYPGIEGNQNTFAAVWVDLNNNGYPDLVLANDTGKVQIFKNNIATRGGFSEISVPSGYGFWMGIAAGDISGNGYQDLFFTNVGTSVPHSVSYGDMTPEQKRDKEHNHIFLENNGLTLTKRVAPSAGFAWGGLLEDINLDGKLDLAFAQNYILAPKFSDYLGRLPGAVFIADGGLNPPNPFTAFSRDYKYINPWYGMTCLSADLRGIGRKDLVWINVAAPIRAYLSELRGTVVNINLPMSAEFLNANVTVISGDKSQTKQNVRSQGFGSDGSLTMSFAVSGGDSAIKINVRGSSTTFPVRFTAGTVKNIEVRSDGKNIILS